MDHLWKVVPLSVGQLLDVRPEDILADGLFRKCETYRGGGGYDQFPLIAEQRWGRRHHLQFIVQLHGCNLDCPYCYVTRAGVWGRSVKVGTDELIRYFAEARRQHGCSVFHLMGGAPALQLKFWGEILDGLEEMGGDWVFHSDLMLTEAPYKIPDLTRICHPQALYAVDVKGLTQAEHLANTRKPFQEALFWANLAALETANVPYYVTFTSVADPNIFWDRYSAMWPDKVTIRKAQAFSIDLIEYRATAVVDSVPWGAS